MSEPELVKLTVDGVEVEVPKGTNLIEAARIAGTEIPHYCYHEDLSVAGNCRMCQVKVQGMPKLTIACNTGATQGMVVQTHVTAPEVAEAQRATLEFLLINHPLDCTVCDQAGHCKLQDYYFEYSAKASRFREQKEHKVKAQPLGPEIIYDGERCILCTRCVRFCDEITHTGELGAFNRGDKSVIGTFPGESLDNPLSGTVADLCPVGALTHRQWRFNSRIWYTTQTDSICPGCSTGCNVKAAVRDKQIVHVKARKNAEVNKEWLCNEGRYGFNRFQPDARLLCPHVTSLDVSATSKMIEVSLENALDRASLLRKSEIESEVIDGAVFLSPLLTVEEMWLAVEYAESIMGVPRDSGHIAISYKERSLGDVEKILVSPDYAPNARAAEVLGIIKAPEDKPTENQWRVVLQETYENLLCLVRAKKLKRILFVGDGSICTSDIDDAFLKGLSEAVTVSLLPGDIDESSATFANSMHGFSKVIFPSRTVLEKNGLMVNKDCRLQRLRALIEPPVGSLSEWQILKKMIEVHGSDLFLKLGLDKTQNERDLSRAMLKYVTAFESVALSKIGDYGLTINQRASDG